MVNSYTCSTDESKFRGQIQKKVTFPTTRPGWNFKCFRQEKNVLWKTVLGDSKKGSCDDEARDVEDISEGFETTVS